MSKAYLGTLTGINTAVTNPTTSIVVPANQIFKGIVSMNAYGSGGQTSVSTITDGSGNIVCVLSPGFSNGANILGCDTKWVELPPGTYTFAVAASFSGTVASSLSYFGGLYRL